MRQMRTIFGGLFFLLLIVGVVIACSDSSDSTTTSTTSNSANSGAAVAAVFGGSEETASLMQQLPSFLLDALVQEVLAQGEGEGPQEGEGGETCGEFEESAESSGPDNVTTTAYGTAGTYGSSSNSVTVTVDDFCQDEEGTVHTGNGPDGDGLFASFVVSEVTISCDDDSADTSMSGTGIFRNRPDDNIFPQIFGTFEVGGAAVNCTIELGEDEEILSSSCSNDAGDVVEQSSDVTCTADAGSDENA